MKPKVCVLRTDGTNCDKETVHAFNLVGGDAEIIHINSLKKEYDPVKQKKVCLEEFNILALPGGFSHGDYIKAGKILAQDLKESLGEKVQKFIDDGKLIIGICNGFQVLVKSGFLPMLDDEKMQTTTLTYNDSNRYEDRWVKLVSPKNNCVWTKGVEKIDLPVAHAEGKFVASEETLKRLFDQNLVVYQYADVNGKPTMEFAANPNASLESIAGICDPSGKIFGLMPHPERYNYPKNHHLAPLQEILSREYVDHSNPIVAERARITGKLPEKGLGLKIFQNAINYFK